MKKYKNVKSILVNSLYNFNREAVKKGAIEVAYSDKIIIKTIFNDKIMCDIERSVNLGISDDSIIKVVFEVIIAIDEPIQKQEFVEDIKKGISALSNVYSKVSLLISEISNMSPFGAIITPPIYDKKIIIE